MREIGRMRWKEREEKKSLKKTENVKMNVK